MTLALGGILQSCSDDDDKGGLIIGPVPHGNAIVTVKPVMEKDSFYMQLDDSTTLSAVNVKKSPYGDKEVRAFILADVMGRPDAKRRHYEVYLHSMDSVLTKPMAPSLADDNAKKYGQDPVEIMRNWTVSEDGYLTLQFTTRWGGAVKHRVNLVQTGKDGAYEVTFYHDASGDTAGPTGSAVVAFRLDKLPDTNGKTVDLTLRWMSYSGEKSAKFKYCTRKPTTLGGPAMTAEGLQRTME